MADTRYLKSIVEDHVRAWLRDKFGQSFKSVPLPLTGVQGIARTHEFDAVSEDESIVCSIQTASWKTSGKKRGSGKVHGAYTELYFLSLIQATQKILILTDPEFFECFTRERSRPAPLPTARRALPANRRDPQGVAFRTRLWRPLKGRPHEHALCQSSSGTFKSP
jgi:hypothetical protein